MRIKAAMRIWFLSAVILLFVACSNGNPMESIVIDPGKVIWEVKSNDGKVVAYLMKDFQGGATEDSIYELVVSASGSNNGLLVFKSDVEGTTVPFEGNWVNDVLHVRYGGARIWNFSNGYPYGNGDSAKTYEIILERQ